MNFRYSGNFSLCRLL